MPPSWGDFHRALMLHAAEEATRAPESLLGRASTSILAAVAGANGVCASPTPHPHPFRSLGPQACGVG